MVDAKKFVAELGELQKALQGSKRILITAPGLADGDSIGSQLALRRMIRTRYSHADVSILNDEPLPERYRFMPDAELVETPESFQRKGKSTAFDLAFVVDGGIDRAGRVKAIFDKVPNRVFIDHHAVSAEYPYTIRMVDPLASSTTEVIYHISQSGIFSMPEDRDFSQQIYLGIIFDTGFFRHSNTTPEVMELAARLMRTNFDFTQVGERGMLARSYSSLQLLSDTLARAELTDGGKVIWSMLTQERLKHFSAVEDDREGIIDHLFLTHGIEVAALFIELHPNETKISLRSQGAIDVASFARSLTIRGGGHQKAAGANLDMPVREAVDWVLPRLSAIVAKA